MALMFVIGGIVLALLIFLMFRRRINKQEFKDELAKKTALCPGCKTNLCTTDSFVRKGVLPRRKHRYSFKCKLCGRASLWDFSLVTPRFIE